MTLNGIDIASYQSSLYPPAMKTTDFIIIKATEGTGYTNTTWRLQSDQTLKAGKLLGLYHYINGSGPLSEARFFVNSIRSYVGHAVLALDWESQGNRVWGNTGYLEQVTREVIRLTGVKPVLYGSATVYAQLSQVAQRTGCALWVAQYATNDPTGYQAHPWNEGAYSCAIRQYSSHGRIPAYGGNLDLDIFYGDRAAWNKLANNKNGDAEMVTNEDIEKIADAVWMAKLPSGAVARDAISPATLNSFWLRDNFAPQLMKQIASLKASVDGYKKAIEQVKSPAGQVDAAAIEKTVEDSVAKALKDVTITLSTDPQKA